MSDPENWTCSIRGNVGLEDGNDGFYYCVRCKVRYDEFIKMGYDTSHNRRRNASIIKAEFLSQPLYDSPSPSSFWNTLTLDAKATPKPQRPIKTEEYFNNGVGPLGPEDFGCSNHSPLC